MVKIKIKSIITFTVSIPNVIFFTFYNKTFSYIYIFFLLAVCLSVSTVLKCILIISSK